MRILQITCSEGLPKAETFSIEWPYSYLPSPNEEFPFVYFLEGPERFRFFYTFFPLLQPKDYPEIWNVVSNAIGIFINEDPVPDYVGLESFLKNIDIDGYAVTDYFFDSFDKELSSMKISHINKLDNDVVQIRMAPPAVLSEHK